MLSSPISSSDCAKQPDCAQELAHTPPLVTLAYPGVVPFGLPGTSAASSARAQAPQIPPLQSVLAAFASSQYLQQPPPLNFQPQLQHQAAQAALFQHFQTQQMLRAAGMQQMLAQMVWGSQNPPAAAVSMFTPVSFSWSAQNAMPYGGALSATTAAVMAAQPLAAGSNAVWPSGPSPHSTMQLAWSQAPAAKRTKGSKDPDS